MNKLDLKKILQYQVPQYIVYSLALGFLCFVSVFLFMCNAEVPTVIGGGLSAYLFGSDISFRPHSYVTLLIFFGILCCLTANIFISYIILNLLTICWGIANRVVYITREQYITIAEFEVLKEAAGVEIDREIMLHPSVYSLFVIEIIIGVIIYKLIKAIKKERSENKKRKFWLLRGVSILFSLVLFFSLYWNPEQVAMENVNAYRNAGCVVWFCQSLFGNTTTDVSYDEVQEIYTNFAEIIDNEDPVSDKRPNIIVIMSEAFWDTNYLKDYVVASENPIDKYYELLEGSVTGEVAVNIYGGGTIQSEFEFLTGINAKYLKNPNSYVEYYAFQQESLVTYMKDLDYYTMALHPYDYNFYNRNVGYVNLGFDIYYTDETFINRDMCHGYISDKSLTQEIIDRFEERKSVSTNQPIFAFAVSVQNHVNDMRNFDKTTAKEDCTGITTEITKVQVNETIDENLNEYYNGLRESIDALEELLLYFENYEEDTIIVFFGDHAPGFVNQISKSSEISLYRTPYMIWTNYENDYESYGDFNISYLSSVLIDYLDLPKPNQYYVNMYMLQHYPINTRYEQEYYDSLDEQRVLDMMSITTTISKRFPKEEMALPFWSVLE